MTSFYGEIITCSSCKWLVNDSIMSYAPLYFCYKDHWGFFPFESGDKDLFINCKDYKEKIIN